MAQLLSRPADARRLGEAAAQRAAAGYTLGTMMDQYVALYATLLPPR